jgi:hypothetical protein
MTGVMGTVAQEEREVARGHIMQGLVDHGQTLEFIINVLNFEQEVLDLGKFVTSTVKNEKDAFRGKSKNYQVSLKAHL